MHEYHVRARGNHGADAGACASLTGQDDETRSLAAQTPAGSSAPADSRKSTIMADADSPVSDAAAHRRRPGILDLRAGTWHECAWRCHQRPRRTATGSIGCEGA